MYTVSTSLYMHDVRFQSYRFCRLWLACAISVWQSITFKKVNKNDVESGMHKIIRLKINMRYCFLIFIKTIIYIQELSYYDGQIHKDLVNNWLRVIPGYCCSYNCICSVLQFFTPLYLFTDLFYTYAKCVIKWNIL